ncbi:ArsR family transcriptional regulator, partial [Klebsiella variicola]
YKRQQKHLEIPASTLSHHLSALISAGRHCCK